MDKPVSFKCGKVAKNPMAVASLTNCQSNTDGTLHEREAVWLERRAKGGYGIVNSCCVHVQANGKGWEGEWGCFGDQHTEGYREVAKRVQAHGSLFIVQVFHAGMRADDALIEGPARSAVDCEYKHRAGVRACKGLTADEVEAMIEDFVKAAKRCEEAGADGVEVHAAHGYILCQFLCPDLNTREDKWGGRLENRARMTREVTRRIRAAVRKDFIVGVRVSPEPGFEKAGWNMDPDEIVQVAQWVAEDGADYVSVSVFGHSPTHVTAKHKDSPAAQPLVSVFRAALPADVVLMMCGGVKSGKDVQTAMANGAGVVLTGTTSISTPDFPARVIADPSFEVSVLPPFSKEHLESVDVSEPFQTFLKSIRMLKE